MANSREPSAERMDVDADRAARSRSRSRSLTPRRSVSGERKYRSRSRSPAKRSRSPVRRSRSPVRRSRSPVRRSRSPPRRSRRGRSRSLSRSRSRSVSPRRYRRNSPPPRRRRSPSRSRSPRRGSRLPSRSPPRRSGGSRMERKELHGTRDQPEISSILGVFGLNMHTRERDLEDVFSKYGPLDKVTVVYDHRAKRSRGFAFVNFVNEEDATRARAETNGLEIDGRRVRVDYSVTHRPHSPTPGEYMGEKRPTFERRYDGRRHRYHRSRSPPRRRRTRSRSWSR
ncbi:unnamed protein product [Cunninghamella blakesleeana]